MVPYGESL